ncbi:GMP/IMP nucleotidase [Abyssibacter sp.]|jgi:putative hydrolase of the HAD superfamily|uniref:GMP/IMP nucleotidase n=1 Tax=Abyssibacter sp. TaxID=2320200 RepID=UPI000C64B686|nr:GMP/IMP nucleotidase [Abyssibacter sp.]MBB88150.1 hypothetical protein [Xanthomonadales bacterium]MCK5859456.1 GMP/IMP nucleotidase [Abyssibacter sp.]
MDAIMPTSSLNWDEIDTVMLDMDGTILDLAYDNWFWQEHIPLEVARSRNVEPDSIRGDLERQFEAAFGTLNWYCLEHWSRELALDIVAHKRASQHRVTPLQGAVDAIEQRRLQGQAIWLVTNAHPLTLEIKLEQTGIAPLFDHLLSSHDFDAPKEHPDFWQRLGERVPHDPARSLFVDDSLRVRHAARSAGYRHVWGIAKPDSRQPAAALNDGPAAESLAAILLS